MEIPKKTDKVQIPVPCTECVIDDLTRDEDGHWFLNGTPLNGVETMQELDNRLWPYIRKLSEALELLHMDINVERRKLIDKTVNHETIVDK